jgi:hypothetical protein
MIDISPHTVAQLLYLVHGDPDELQEALGEIRPADIAEALRELRPDAAGKVMAALPFDLAVQVFDDPELTRALRGACNHGRLLAHRDRRLRIARRIDAAVSAQTPRLRSCERIGSIRRYSGRCHGTRDLLLGRVSRPAWQALVTAAVERTVAPSARDYSM